MHNLYDINALVHWTEREIELREDMIRFFAREVRTFLKGTNPAWEMHRVEAPLLMPRRLVSTAYTNEDIWVQERLSESEHDLVLRPETTPSTYAYMTHLLENHSRTRPPFCVWQAGKSFRREQEQPTKHMRLKEFWQMEFQCAFTADSMNDYHAASLEPVRKMIASMINLPTRIIPSDRLPAYSEKTMDIEVENPDKWMEVCSISLRTDFPVTWKAPKKDEVPFKVLEIAIGLDRCVHNWMIASQNA